MKSFFKNISLVVLTFGALSATAQNFPVQANLSITPPYSVYLQDYISPGVDKLNLNILPTDFTISELRVKLRISIEGQNVTLRTKSSFQPTPLFINGGVPLRLTGFDIAEYLNPDNLDFQGISKQQFLQNGALPEGVYRFNIEVIEFNRNVVVSNKAFVVAWIILNDPPLINLPFQGEKVRATDPQNVIFQWTPRHTGSPNSAFATEYEFSLVEIWPAGRDPEIAMRSTSPIYQTTTQSTTLVYGIAEPALVPGRSYAFRVRAKSMVGIDELDLFKNDGYSQTGTFTFGDECKPPTGIESNTISAKSFNATWNTAFNHTGFNVRYRESAERNNSWYEEESFIGEQRIGALKPETTYEVQVRAACGSLESPYSESLAVVTVTEGEIAFSCGVPPEAYGLENREPLQNLFIGEYIYANDFDIKVREVTGSNGIFSGTGLAEMPLFSLAKVRVNFEGISVNTDYRLVDGVVTTIYDPNSSMMVDLDPEDTLEDEADDGTSGDDVVADSGNDINYDEPIDSVYVDDNGDIVVVMEDGSTDTVTPDQDGSSDDEEPEDTVITDSEGNTWTVDSGGNVTPGEGNGGSDTGNPIPSDSINQISPDSLILVQERLITELIIYFDDEIDYWLLTHGKGPLEIQEIRRLLELPGCLPEDGGQLEIIQTALNSLLEDISGFLSSLFETDGNQDILDEICQDLDTTRESLLTQLSDEDLETCEEMLCEYLNEDEYDFTLELLQSEDIQESGSTLLISAEPQMPDIRARVALENNNDVEVEMRLIIEYSRTCPDAPSRSRNDITYFPSTGWHRANTNDTWDIDFGHDNSVGIQRPMIRGGRASLIFRFGEMQGDTVEFMIKGENPTVEEVMDALDEAPYSNIWFMKKMALHESGTRNPTNNNSRAQQFNYQNDCCESLDEDWDAWSRCPTRGAPCGWGLMQMDLPAPTVQSMWDWRANIHQAYNLLNGEKRQSVINHMRRSMNTINSWNQRNSDDQVQEHDDQEEGGMTYTHSLSNQFQNTGITNFDDHFGDEPDGDDKSFLDACWIKTYNGLGTARLHFYYITQEGANRPEWNISNTATYGNSVNYYVEDISEQDTPD